MAALVKFSLAIVLSIALTVNSALMTNNSSSVSKSFGLLCGIISGSLWMWSRFQQFSNNVRKFRRDR